MEKKNTVFSILLLVSYALLIGILIAIMIKNNFSEKNKFRNVYTMSKILTIKNMVANSHNSEIIFAFSSSGEASGLTSSYKSYLKLLNKDKCIENYKPCGILDTIGHKLCIDETLDCPINNMKVDTIHRTDNYLAKNYHYTQLSNTSIDYRFFYSNSYEEGNVGVIIVKSKDEPKYISKSNFIVDSDFYEKMFGSGKLLEDLSSIFGISKDKGKNDNNNDDTGNMIKIVELLIDASSGGETELYKLGAKGILVFLTDSYNELIDRFKKYIETKLEEEGEEDIYFHHIGDNFYVKNYIGFKSAENINKFLKFDFTIFNKKFLSSRVSMLTLFLILAIAITFIVLIFLFAFKKDKYFFKPLGLILQFFFIYLTSLGFLINSVLIYFQVNKNKKLEELKAIESDEFINNFIKEFVSQCQESLLIFCTIIIIGLSFIIFLITIIIYKVKGNKPDYSFVARTSQKTYN